MELRESRRHGLKMRKDYDIAKESFLATKNPSQRQQRIATAHMAQMTEAKTIDTMANSNVKIFYGDYSRNDEDPTAWMQSLNTRKVANIGQTQRRSVSSSPCWWKTKKLTGGGMKT